MFFVGIRLRCKIAEQLCSVINHSIAVAVKCQPSVVRISVCPRQTTIYYAIAVQIKIYPVSCVC